MITYASIFTRSPHMLFITSCLCSKVPEQIKYSWAYRVFFSPLGCPFFKELDWFLEMNLCYKILNNSCCFLTCHISKNQIYKGENILNLKKNTLYLDCKRYGPGRHCFCAMETHLFSINYIWIAGNYSIFSQWNKFMCQCILRLFPCFDYCE